MKKLVSLVVFGSALALSACGGSSDSSGGLSLGKTGSGGSGHTPSSVGSSKTCKTSADGKIVNVTVEGCKYSVAGFNHGKRQTYTCVSANGRVETKGRSGNPLVINDVIFECTP